MNALKSEIEKRLRQLLDDEVSKASEEILNKAKQELDLVIRKKVGELSLCLADYFSVEKFGRELRITVFYEKENV